MAKKKVHFIGIGGISMSGIAEMLLANDYEISGSDIKETSITTKLREHGANVIIGHHPELVEKADIIVYTAAIPDDDLEKQAALNLNKECYERAQFLGLISKQYDHRLCISGTHGKSTTTGLISTVFLHAGKNPTIQIGAFLPSINGNYYIGDNDYLIMEACEYVDSFLHFYPTSEVILNIDDDHLDYFKNIENIKKSFTKYLNLLPSDGVAVVNIDDKNVQDILKNTSSKIITYALKEKADFTAQNITKNNQGFYSFDVLDHDNLFLHLNLKINGKHNIYNAISAVALCNYYGINKDIIKEGIESYQGVDRRFQFLGKYNDALIYDDYAHHPTEIASTLESVQTVKHHESWAIFQAHTFSRTKEHLSEFAEILANFDHIIIASIYPARETNIYNVHEEDLVNLIKEKNPHVLYIDSFAKIEEYLKENIQPQDIVITIGAGPINEVAYNLVKEKSIA